MSKLVTRLYPQPSEERPLEGLYLGEQIQEVAQGSATAFVYTNYVVSLDGRIAVSNQDGKKSVPSSIANPRDWRLFQELAVQADVLITSGRYLRSYKKKTSQDILGVYDDPAFWDLKEWRFAQDLPLYPALAVLSRSLDFEIPDILVDENRSLLILTTEDADQESVKALVDQGAVVVFTGTTQVDGKRLKENLQRRGFQAIYNTAGPKALHILASAGVLDRLYLTYVNRLLGGDPFSPILEGPLLQQALDFQLRSIYHDPHLPEAVGQLFVSYTRRE